MSAIAIAGGTKIEWADFTFNPWWGCEKVSPGCAHCYAETLARRRQPGSQLWGEGHGFRFFGDGHWQDPVRWARNAPAKLGRRPRVFCASMADVFEDRDELLIPRLRLLSLITDTPELDWLVLTKRPEFAKEILLRCFTHHAARPWEFPLPPNLWLGVSIENSRHTWRADVLREIPAAVRFISAEPLLGSLYDGRRDDAGAGRASDCGDEQVRGFAATSGEGIREGRTRGATRGARASEVDRGRDHARFRPPLDLTHIDWVIVGGESGHGARPFHLEHAREITEACLVDFARPAIFVKQLGAAPIGGRFEPDGPLKLRDSKGSDMSEWPADLQIREFPGPVA